MLRLQIVSLSFSLLLVALASPTAPGGSNLRGAQKSNDSIAFASNASSLVLQTTGGGATTSSTSFEELSGFCRTVDGEKGVFKKVSVNAGQCRVLCSAEPSCVAFEYTPGLKCELHSTTIKTIEPADGTGTTCEVKLPSPPAFNTLHGLCRTQRGGKGTFHSVKVNLAECKLECSKDPKCVAFEYMPGLQCELHTEVITTVHPFPTATCGIKLPSPVAFDTLSGLCRTQHGGKGTFHSVRVNLAECELKCGKDPKCVAFEYRPGLECELHTEVITTVHPYPDATCQVKPRH